MGFFKGKNCFIISRNWYEINIMWRVYVNTRSVDKEISRSNCNEHYSSPLTWYHPWYQINMMLLQNNIGPMTEFLVWLSIWDPTIYQRFHLLYISMITLFIILSIPWGKCETYTPIYSRGQYIEDYIQDNKKNGIKFLCWCKFCISLLIWGSRILNRRGG